MFNLHVYPVVNLQIHARWLFVHIRSLVNTSMFEFIDRIITPRYLPKRVKVNVNGELVETITEVRWQKSRVACSFRLPIV